MSRFSLTMSKSNRNPWSRHTEAAEIIRMLYGTAAVQPLTIYSEFSQNDIGFLWVHQVWSLGSYWEPRFFVANFYFVIFPSRADRIPIWTPYTNPFRSWSRRSEQTGLIIRSIYCSGIPFNAWYSSAKSALIWSSYMGLISPYAS